ncbi:MAG: isopentenyl-diphosphate delta-isomerase [Saprospiraceae bacterium]
MHKAFTPLPDDDPTAATRKKDHIELALKSQVEAAMLDGRFSYEPLLAAHPDTSNRPTTNWVGKTLRLPLWVSSMTGGTEKAYRINHNLAQACRDFGMGMGLGSCRPLLYGDERLKDFDIRPILGDDQILFANLGIAQLETLLAQNEIWRVSALVDKLRADGLIIHVNPLQEWLQPEGDRFLHPPIDTIQRVMEALPDLPIIVKEVGQGMGRKSLEALLQLPLAAIDFAAAGGTNFARLELLRAAPARQAVYGPLSVIGHTAIEMTQMVNELITTLGDRRQCGFVIISGGIANFLDGFYLMKKLNISSIYGQASAFLQHAQGEYEALHAYVEMQARGLDVANAFLRINQ